MECLKMITVTHGEYRHKVPCGKCAYCLQSKRSQWMFRVYHEMRQQDNPGWFITLTYDEKHVKRTAYGLSLRFRDVQLFLKKLRKAKYYAKYICVGEYGSQTKRPHYHMLLWTDCPVDALPRYWSTRDGTPLGNIHLGRITMQSAMYTLKYIIQPKTTEKDGVEKTRAQFSKGLGLGYLTSAVYEYHTSDYDHPVITSVIDGNTVALPRYYRYKIFTKYQMAREGHRLKWQSIRERRKEIRRLKKLGIENAFAYMQTLRAENARRIIEKTKVNEKL